MIIFILMLFIVGVFGIILEHVLPFGISMIIGLSCIGYGTYLAVQESGWQVGTIYCIMAISVAMIVARMTIRTSIKFGRLDAPKKKGPKPAGTEPQPGDEAVVVQILRPTGTIEWEGRRLPARSLYVEKEIANGARVRVRSKDSIYFLVEAVPAGETVGVET